MPGGGKCGKKNDMKAKLFDLKQKSEKSQKAVELQEGSIELDQINVESSCDRSQLGDPNISDDEFEERLSQCFANKRLLANDRISLDKKRIQAKADDDAYDNFLDKFNHCKKRNGWK